MHGHEITGELIMTKKCDNDNKVYIEMGQFKIEMTSFVAGLLFAAFLVWIF